MTFVAIGALRVNKSFISIVLTLMSLLPMVTVSQAVLQTGQVALGKINLLCPLFWY